MTSVRRFDVDSDYSNSDEDSPKPIREKSVIIRNPPSRWGGRDENSDEEISSFRRDSKAFDRVKTSPARQQGFRTVRSSTSEFAVRGKAPPKEMDSFDEYVQETDDVIPIRGRKFDERENHADNWQDAKPTEISAATVKFERSKGPPSSKPPPRNSRRDHVETLADGQKDEYDNDGSRGDDESADSKDEESNQKFKDSTNAPRRSGRYDDAKPTTMQYAQQRAASNNIPFTLVAPRGGNGMEHVQCTIVRDRTFAGRLTPTYELILESANRCIIVAKKTSMNTTSNYQMFDMTRGTPGSSLTKKSANYMGKLRAHSTSRTEYTVVNSSMTRQEIAAITYERQGVVKHITDGSQPRKMWVLLPGLDEDNIPIPHSVDEEGDSMLNQLSGMTRYQKFHSKDPVYDSGNYRLNFKGRVTTPSVKNFQLVPEGDIDDIVCQFGKVGDDKFHLDYKAPLNAMQAFSLALSQFNL